MTELLTKNCRRLRNKNNAKVIYTYVHMSSLLNENNALNKNKVDIEEISHKLDMDKPNVWKSLKEMEELGMLNIINTESDKKIEVLL